MMRECVERGNGDGIKKISCNVTGTMAMLVFVTLKGIL